MSHISAGLKQVTRYKFKRKYSQRMSVATTSSTQPVNNNNNNNNNNKNTNNNNNNNDETNQIDFESKCGRFGWATIDGIHVPYIIRLGKKYFAIRVVDAILLQKYLHKDRKNLQWSSVVNYYSDHLTESEIVLMNEINTIHCNGQFGKAFSAADHIMRFEDAKLLYEYLGVCYYKLGTHTADMRDHCGFIRINKKIIVAYVYKQGTIVIPIFYFEKHKAFNTGMFATGWDLQYLSFCFAAQGIQNFNKTKIEVIPLDAVKQRFPSGTSFEPFWPDLTSSTSVNNNTSTNQVNIDRKIVPN